MIFDHEARTKNHQRQHFLAIVDVQLWTLWLESKK